MPFRDPVPSAALVAGDPAPQIDEMFVVFFLVFVGVVLLSGLFLAWRYWRRDRRGSSKEPKAQRPAETTVMLSMIETLDAVDEEETDLQINLQDESSAVADRPSDYSGPSD